MSFISDIFGSNGDPYYEYSRRLQDYANEYNKWIQTGLGANSLLNTQYTNLVNNPDFEQNKIASDYYGSPYQSYLTDQLQKTMNINSANTGMIGGGAAQLALAKQLNGMTGQFENNYINRGLGSYGQGLSGLGDISRLGFNAQGQRLGILQDSAAAQMKGQQQENSLFPNMIGELGGFAMGLPGMIKSYGGLFSSRPNNPLSQNNGLMSNNQLNQNNGSYNPDYQNYGGYYDGPMNNYGFGWNTKTGLSGNGSTYSLNGGY